MADSGIPGRYGEIYDRGYQHYLGQRLGRQHAIWALILYSIKRAMGIKKSWTAKVIPFILYLFQNSLTSELSFENYRSAVSSSLGKLVLLALIWAFIHHLLAGIRFLLLDLHIAGERQQGANTARVVLGLSGLLTLVCALLLFGVL